MKSAATFALCALLVLGYCSRSRGDHSITVAPASAPHGPPGTFTTTTARSSTPHRGDGKTASESTAVVAQKPSPTPSSSLAPVLHSTLANVSDTNERVPSTSADANGKDTNATHSTAPPPLSTNQTGTQAPALTVTDGTAVPTAAVGANGTHQTGSATTASPTAASTAPGIQTEVSEDNGTLSTSPPTTTAPASAVPPAVTQPIDSKTQSTSPTTTTTTSTMTTPLTTAAPEIVPQSASPVPGHKKPTGSSTTISSTTTTTTTTITNIKVSTATTSGSVAKSTTTTKAAALSELNVGDDEGSSKGVPDPLLAGLVSVFVVAAAIVSLLVFLKFRNRNERPEFRRLQDLPMDDMMEDTPLSMYSY
ncbi:cell wall protein DAN4-like isoform X2 [Alosa sapidissima]|uniref:cell wall protein DAN4-like isoform X2 n=1 Tax=Alosa sapidissima TaxID=34773 RepID=UPI001C09FA5E|nr:cell wall protein DAN4-like isoform X2 [Alosa sapidissima]